MMKQTVSEIRRLFFLKQLQVPCLTLACDKGVLSGRIYENQRPKVSSSLVFILDPENRHSGGRDGIIKELYVKIFIVRVGQYWLQEKHENGKFCS